MKNNGGSENHPYASAMAKAGQEIPTEVFQAIYRFILDRKSGNLIISVTDGYISTLKTETYTRFRKR